MHRIWNKMLGLSYVWPLPYVRPLHDELYPRKILLLIKHQIILETYLFIWNHKIDIDSETFCGDSTYRGIRGLLVACADNFAMLFNMLQGALYIHSTGMSRKLKILRCTSSSSEHLIHEQQDRNIELWTLIWITRNKDYNPIKKTLDHSLEFFGNRRKACFRK